MERGLGTVNSVHSDRDEQEVVCNFGVCAFGRQCVEGSGPLPAPLLLIGEAPGRQELKHGAPFLGPAGKLLDELLHEAGLSRDTIRITNTVGCVDMSRDDKRPLPAELDACAPRLHAELDLCSPVVVVLMGNTALNVLYPGYKIGQVYTKWRVSGTSVVIPTYHPSHVLRGNKQVRPVILDALKSARRLISGSR